MGLTRYMKNVQKVKISVPKVMSAWLKEASEKV